MEQRGGSTKSHQVVQTWVATYNVVPLAATYHVGVGVSGDYGMRARKRVENLRRTPMFTTPLPLNDTPSLDPQGCHFWGGVIYGGGVGSFVRKPMKNRRRPKKASRPGPFGAGGVTYGGGYRLRGGGDISSGQFFLFKSKAGKQRGKKITLMVVRNAILVLFNLVPVSLTFFS